MCISSTIRAHSLPRRLLALGERVRAGHPSSPRHKQSFGGLMLMRFFPCTISSVSARRTVWSRLPRSELSPAAEVVLHIVTHACVGARQTNSTPSDASHTLVARHQDGEAMIHMWAAWEHLLTELLMQMVVVDLASQLVRLTRIILDIII
jgi:hypothetical protein